MAANNNHDTEYRPDLYAAFVEDHKGLGAMDYDADDSQHGYARARFLTGGCLLVVLAVAAGWWLIGG